MTKKDYEALASAIADAVNDEGSDYATFGEGVEATAIRIARVLADDNPRFDCARFLMACGCPQEARP